jgi:hypothetical protein
LTNSRGEIVEDNENKAVDWGGQVVFGYTGLARVLGKPTDYWLSEALLVNISPQGTISLDEAIESVRAKATKDFKRMVMKDKRWKRLIIMGAGWVQFFDTKQIKPSICLISNCIDDTGNYLVEPYDEFKINRFIFNEMPNGFITIAIGQQLNHAKGIALNHNISRCLKHAGIGPEPVSRLLIEAIRDVAKYNITVGCSVLVACIPKESIHSSRIRMRDGSVAYIVLSSKPRKFDRTFQYVPDGQDEGVEYGPNFVLGGSWLRGFYVMGKKGQDQRTVSVKTMRLEPGAKQGLILLEDGINGHFISPPQ